MSNQADLHSWKKKDKLEEMPAYEILKWEVQNKAGLSHLQMVFFSQSEENFKYHDAFDGNN